MGLIKSKYLEQIVWRDATVTLIGGKMLSNFTTACFAHHVVFFSFLSVLAYNLTVEYNVSSYDSAYSELVNAIQQPKKKTNT